MADHLTDEEQLQQLKHWWKDNGTSLMAAVLLGLIAYFGFQWWQNLQRQQSEQASVLYAELLQVVEVAPGASVSDENKSTAVYLTKQLQDDYSSSQYAINANFLAAKLAVNSNDLDAAETSLLWIASKADEPTKALADLRLARVYIAQKKYDAAFALVDTGTTDAFTSLNAELKGDILVVQEKWLDARQAYQQAIDTLGETSSFRRRLLPVKLANLPAGDK